MQDPSTMEALHVGNRGVELGPDKFTADGICRLINDALETRQAGDSHPILQSRSRNKEGQGSHPIGMSEEPQVC